MEHIHCHNSAVANKLAAAIPNLVVNESIVYGDYTSIRMARIATNEKLAKEDKLLVLTEYYGCKTATQILEKI